MCVTESTVSLNMRRRK